MSIRTELDSIDFLTEELARIQKLRKLFLQSGADVQDIDCSLAGVHKLIISQLAKAAGVI